jgi:hypothetical protein
MAKSNRKRSTRKQSGGDSASYTFGSAVSAGAPYASEVIAKPGCVATPRPGEIPNYSPPGLGGLPGFAGGGRRRKRSLLSKNYTRKIFKSLRFFGRKKRQQKGGRYTLDVASTTGGPNPFVPVQRLGCEGGSINTLPPDALQQRGGKQRGASKRRRQSGGVGGVDSAFYQAPTAGYGNEPSKWVSSTGTPSLLQTPYDAKAYNPACLKTGGGSKHRRGTRRNRKH